LGWLVLVCYERKTPLAGWFGLVETNKRTGCLILACLQMPDATPKQIKKAYYNCMKSCHPDLSGNDPDMTNFCMFINEVYTVQSQEIKSCHFLNMFYGAILKL